MTEGKRRNLGRGLDALLGADDEVSNTKTGEQLILIAINQVKPSPLQPRRNFDEESIADLAESIKEKGILQPLIVRLSGNDDFYEIIAGERRFRAAQMVGLKELPVIVKNLSDKEVLEVALVENLQRQDLSPLEEAEGYQKLIDEFGHTQEILAKVVGKSRSHVANTLRLLNLPDEVKKMLQKGELSSGHARALLNSENMLELANEVIKKGLNVRQTENLVKNPVNHSPIKKTKETPEKEADLIALEQSLSRLMGMKVFIRSLGRGGEIAIKYSNLEELDDILYKLSQLLNANKQKVATAEQKQAAPQEISEDINEEVVEIDQPEAMEEEIEVIEEVVKEIVEPEIEDEIVEEIVEEVVEEVVEAEPEPVQEIVEEVIEEIIEEEIEPEPEIIEEIIEEVVEAEPEPEVLEEPSIEEEIVEEIAEEIIEEAVELESEPDTEEAAEEDDWAVGLDTVIGLEDEPEEETSEEAIPDDAWANALKPDDGDDLEEENKN